MWHVQGLIINIFDRYKEEERIFYVIMQLNNQTFQSSRCVSFETHHLELLPWDYRFASLRTSKRRAASFGWAVVFRVSRHVNFLKNYSVFVDSIPE